MPLASSAHLMPTLQAIISTSEPPTVHLVQPAAHSTLEALLKRQPLDERHAHAIFCQLSHALWCVHEQGFFHGSMLLSSALIRDEPDASRLPFALLDLLHVCKCVRPSSAQRNTGRSPSKAAEPAQGGAGTAAATSATCTQIS